MLGFNLSTTSKLTCNWVNGKSHTFSLICESFDKFSNGILSLGNAQAIAGCNDDVFGVLQKVSNSFNIGLSMCP